MADVRRFELEELVQPPRHLLQPDHRGRASWSTTRPRSRPAWSTRTTTQEWVLLGDEPAVDEHRRDELVERFETRSVGTGPETDDEVVEDEDELEPDPDDDY